MCVCARARAFLCIGELCCYLCPARVFLFSWAHPQTSVTHVSLFCADVHVFTCSCVHTFIRQEFICSDVQRFVCSEAHLCWMCSLVQCGVCRSSRADLCRSEADVQKCMFTCAEVLTARVYTACTLAQEFVSLCVQPLYTSSRVCSFIGSLDSMQKH